jgi:6-phosphofructokinase
MGAYAVECARKGLRGIAIGVNHENIIHYAFSESFKEPNPDSLKPLFDLVPKLS